MGRFRLFCMLIFLTAASLYGQINISFMVTDAACLDGSILVMATGGSGSYQYEIVGNTCGLSNRSLQSSPEFRNLPPCTYTVLVLDGTGTSATRDVVVGGNYMEPSATVETDACAFTIHVKNGKPPFRYAISADGGLSYGPASSKNTHSNLAAGTYHLRIEDSCGTVLFARATLTPDTPDFYFERVFRDKITDSIAPVFTGGEPGSYRFYIVNGMDTLRSAYNTFALNDIIKTCSTRVIIESDCGSFTQDFTYADAELLCLDQTAGTAEIRVNVGIGPFTSYFYPDSAPEMIFPGLNLTGLPPNSLSYSFGVQDACGHHASGSFESLARKRNDFKFKSSHACGPEDSLRVEISQNNPWARQVYTVECTSCTPVQLMSQVETSATFKSLNPGRKTITIRDSCGSSWTCTGDYFIPARQRCDTTSFQLVYAFTCPTGLTNPGDTLRPEMYYLRSDSGQLIDSNSRGLFARLEEGTYSIQALVAGCGLIERIYMHEQDQGFRLRMVPDGPVEGCAGDSILLRGEVIGGSEPLEFIWSNGSRSKTIWIHATGIHSLKVRDGAGCLDSASVDIHIGTPIEYNVAVKGYNCSGEAGSVGIHPSGGLPPYGFHWSNGQKDSLLSELVAGTYGITITDRAGCTDSIYVTLEEPTPLVLEGASTPASCAISRDGIAQVHPSGGTGVYAFQWNTGHTGDRLSGINPGSYSVTVTDQALCRAISTIEVGQQATIISQRVDTICTGSTLTVGRSEYRVSGDYRDTLKTALGCDSLVLTRLTVNPPVSFELVAVNPVCRDQSNGSIAILGITPKPPYQFHLNGRAVEGLMAKQLAGGNYIVRITDGFGCSTEKGISLSNPPRIEFQAGSDSLLSFGDSIQLRAITNLEPAEIKSIRWLAGQEIICSHCSALTLSPKTDLVIKAELENLAGCMVEDVFTLRVNTAFRVFAPNILYMPATGGGGVNGRFTLYGSYLESIEYLRIYDRYGALVYEIKEGVPGDWTEGWDGYTGQKPASPGVYVYVARVRFADESRQVLRGDITVIR